MQIVAHSPEEALSRMGDFVDIGWVMVSIAASSSKVEQIVSKVNTLLVFDQICNAKSIGINAINFSKTNEFVITLVINPDSKVSVKYAKEFLKSMKSTGMYGKQILSNNLQYKNDKELNKVINSFWKTSKKKILLSLIAFIGLALLLTYVGTNIPYIVDKVPFQLFNDITIKYTRNPESMRIALNKSENMELLFSIAMIGRDERRLDDIGIYKFSPLAVENIYNQKKLLQIAKKANYFKSQVAAINKLKDQYELYHLATGSYSETIKRTAASALTDQHYIEQVAFNGESKEIRRAAAKNVISEETLTELAMEVNLFNEVVVPKITNQKYLAKIITQSNSSSAIKIAVENIYDKDILMDIILTHDWGISSKTLRNILYKFSDQEKLFYMAKNAKSKFARDVIVENIIDQDKLLYIAKNEKYDSARATAIERITDQSYLKYIVLNDRVSFVKYAAIRALTDKDFLENLVYNSKDSSIRSKSKKRLKKL